MPSSPLHRAAGPAAFAVAVGGVRVAGLVVHPWWWSRLGLSLRPSAMP